MERKKETPEEYRNRTSRNKLVHEFKLKPLEIQLLIDRVNRGKGRGYVADYHDAYLLHVQDLDYKNRIEQALIRERQQVNNEEQAKKKLEELQTPQQIRNLRDIVGTDLGYGRRPTYIQMLNYYEKEEGIRRIQQQRIKEHEDWENNTVAGREYKRLQEESKQTIKSYKERQEMGAEDELSRKVETIKKREQEVIRQQRTRVEMGEEDVKSQRLRENTKETERLMLLAREREMAMRLPTLEEGEVIDRSDQWRYGVLTGRKLTAEEIERLSKYGETGVGLHKQTGERGNQAKLNDALAQEIRKEYWRIPDQSIEAFSKRMVVVLKEQLDITISPSSIKSVISRKTWIDPTLFPLVEGEPESQLKRLSELEYKLLKRAEKEGLTTGLGKGSRKKLTDEDILEAREEIARLLREKETDKGRKKAEKDEAKRVKKEADDLKKTQEKVAKKLEREAQKKLKKEKKAEE